MGCPRLDTVRLRKIAAGQVDPGRWLESADLLAVAPDATGQALNRHFLTVSFDNDLNSAISDVATKCPEQIVLGCNFAISDCHQHVALPKWAGRVGA